MSANGQLGKMVIAMGNGDFLRSSSLSKPSKELGRKRGRAGSHLLALFSSNLPNTSLCKDTPLLFGISPLQITLFFLSPLHHFNGQQASEEVRVSMSSHLLHSISPARFLSKTVCDMDREKT